MPGSSLFRCIAFLVGVPPLALAGRRASGGVGPSFPRSGYAGAPGRSERPAEAPGLLLFLVAVPAIIGRTDFFGPFGIECAIPIACESATAMAASGTVKRA